MLNIVLAVFNLVFLANPSVKSTFAQKQSCSSSLPLQLLFWSNLKLLYENLSFGRSKSGQIWSNEFTVCSLCDAVRARRPYRRLDAGELVHTSAIAPRPRRLSALPLSSRTPWKLLLPSVPFPFLELEMSRAERSRRRSPGRPTLAALPRSFAPQPL